MSEPSSRPNENTYQLRATVSESLYDDVEAFARANDLTRTQAVRDLLAFALRECESEAQQRDAAEAHILENVRLGYMEFAGVGEDGELNYRLTDAGKRRVEEMGEESSDDRS